jgi:hypothetical protein
VTGPGVRLAVAGRRPAPTPARRLVLTGAEWAVLVAGRLAAPAPGFAPAPVAPADEDAAAQALVTRGVATRTADGAPEPVPPVAVNLDLLDRPLLTVRLDVTVRGGERHAWLAVGSGLLAAVVTLPGGRFELSMAPAVRLGTELARAVPDAAGSAAPLVGSLPLTLLGDAATDDAGPADVELAAALERRTLGSLSCLVLGRAGDALGAGQVSWLATDAGWLGLRPRLDGSSERVVDLVPVEPADLGTWVAPTVAGLLEAADELP